MMYQNAPDYTNCSDSVTFLAKRMVKNVVYVAVMSRQVIMPAVQRYVQEMNEQQPPQPALSTGDISVDVRDNYVYDGDDDDDDDDDVDCHIHINPRYNDGSNTVSQLMRSMHARRKMVLDF